MYHLCSTLVRVQKNFVDFDVHNSEHIRAFHMLCLGEEINGKEMIKQHPSLRFNLEEPYEDVRAMMLKKVGEQYCKDIILKHHV